MGKEKGSRTPITDRIKRAERKKLRRRKPITLRIEKVEEEKKRQK